MKNYERVRYCFVRSGNKYKEREQYGDSDVHLKAEHCRQAGVVYTTSKVT